MNIKETIQNDPRVKCLDRDLSPYTGKMEHRLRLNPGFTFANGRDTAFSSRMGTIKIWFSEIEAKPSVIDSLKANPTGRVYDVRPKKTTTHTPGPWTADSLKRADGKIRINNDKTQIACIPWSTDEDRANANLIAASPDLLDVVHFIADNRDFLRAAIVAKGVSGPVLYNWDWTFMQAENAVAKAEGKS